VAAMIFNVYWPVLEFFCFWGMRFGFRWMDRRFSCNKYTTKKSTLQTYIELYSGPTFFIHYKYSTILVITFVTMMYGLGMPILFPIASASVFSLYCVEKFMIHWSYRQPPAYDEKLNNNVLGLMTWSPLLFLSFGYWMFSNKQLIDNVVFMKTNRNDVVKTGHYWGDVFSQDAYHANPAMPLLVMFWVFLFGTVFRNFIMNRLCRWFPSMQIGALEVDEGLDNYFKCIDDHDRNWSIKEEENAREQLKLKILDDETLHKLKTTAMGEGSIKGVHCYDILANPLYLDDFQYFSPSMDNRNDYIIDDDEDEGNDQAQSDLVKMVLNLAFLTEEKAKSFTFDKNSYKNQVQGKLGKIN
jgi:hypothetical protein